MSRVCKKIAGLFGLAFVIGITAVASGIPPMPDASAVNGDINIQVKVTDANFMAQIIEPTEGSLTYADDGVTARISYSEVQSISVYLTFPDGHQVLVDTITPGSPSGELDVALPVINYGNYTLTVTGTDLSGNPMNGDAKAFAYRAVTAQPSEDHSKVAVSYGTNVCKLGFQIYKVADTTKQNPLLNPEYVIEVQQTGSNPNTTEIEIPGFAQLGPDEFNVVVTAYDCLNSDPVDSEDINMAGVITPPKTGSINILGITISQTDYLVTGLIAFALAAIFAVFLLTRRKKASRRN